MDRLGVTFTYSSYFILCLSVAVETSVNFVAADSVFIRCCRNVCYLLLWEVPTSPPAEMVAQMLKRKGKCMWRPEHVVFVGGCGGVVGGAIAGFAMVGGFGLVSLRM
jgi:hypothetical protein